MLIICGGLVLFIIVVFVAAAIAGKKVTVSYKVRDCYESLIARYPISKKRLRYLVEKDIERKFGVPDKAYKVYRLEEV